MRTNRDEYTIQRQISTRVHHMPPVRPYTARPEYILGARGGYWGCLLGALLGAMLGMAA